MRSPRPRYRMTITGIGIWVFCLCITLSCYTLAVQIERGISELDEVTGDAEDAQIRAAFLHVIVNLLGSLLMLWTIGYGVFGTAREAAVFALVVALFWLASMGVDALMWA